jgi:hypothetical protein
MMQNSIQDGGGDDVISEDISPFAIGLIGCEYDRSPLIPPGDQLEEAVGTQLVKGEISYLIDYQEVKLG